MDITEAVSIISVLVTVAALVAGSLGYWVATRRKHSGDIGTSEASVLWKQSESMRKDMQRRAERAEEQRDRVISGYEQILPMVTSLNLAVKGLTETVAEILSLLRPDPPGKREVS